jgi:hypothetical protein
MINLKDLNYLGEWSQNMVIGLLSGLISGFLVSFVFIFPSYPNVAFPFMMLFLVIFVVFLVSNVIIQCYREKVNRAGGAGLPEITQTQPAHETITFPLSDASKSDIDNFCKSVIAWKVSATAKEEIFELFRDNPYYLMGYLAYITKKDIEETKALQKKIVALTLVALIIGMGTMVFAGYSINPVYIIPGIGVYALVFYGVYLVLRRPR